MNYGASITAVKLLKSKMLELSKVKHKLKQQQHEIDSLKAEKLLLRAKYLNILSAKGNCIVVK